MPCISLLVKPAHLTSIPKKKRVCRYFPSGTHLRPIVVSYSLLALSCYRFPVSAFAANPPSQLGNRARTATALIYFVCALPVFFVHCFYIFMCKQTSESAIKPTLCTAPLSGSRSIRNAHLDVKAERANPLNSFTIRPVREQILLKSAQIKSPDVLQKSQVFVFVRSWRPAH